MLLDGSGRKVPPSPRRWLTVLLTLVSLRRGIPGLVAFLGTLAALGFSIIYILNNVVEGGIAQKTEVASVESISQSEAAPGTEVEVIGENLGNVVEARLSKGVIDERIFLLPISDTRVIVNVPRGIEADTYFLELRFDGEDSFMVAGNLEVLDDDVGPSNGGSETGGNDGEPIVFADLNWDSAQIQNAIARFIIENGYGYPTDSIGGPPPPLWDSIFEGDIDVMMEGWLPNYQAWWDKGLEEGSIIPLGKSLDDNWQSAFVIPTYVAEANPGLKSVSDLPDYREIFATGASGGRAVLVTCLVVWECSKINNDQVRAYGLEEVIELKYPASQGALFASLENAYENREPWLGYLWGPTQIASKLELTRLEEPPYSESCWDVHKGCAYPTSRIRIVVNPGLLERAPQVMEFLRKWDLDTPTQVTIEEQFAANGSNLQETVAWFLKNNEAVWVQWVPHNVFARVRDAVKDQ